MIVSTSEESSELTTDQRFALAEELNALSQEPHGGGIGCRFSGSDEDLVEEVQRLRAQRERERARREDDEIGD